ncbi:MAG: uroporphyrinogen decarboxylase family protein [Lachnospiraceae bacterium]
MNDYRNILNAAYNKKSSRIPLYEHNVSLKVIGELQHKNLIDMELEERMIQYCKFFQEQEYDVVTFEGCVVDMIPGGGALGRHQDGCIKTMEDFKKYPWEEVLEIYKSSYDRQFAMLQKHMPQGMKGIGGIGNGVFEVVQDLVGYEELCYIKVDDEELYRCLFQRVGSLLLEIWDWFLEKYPDLYAVCRIGDDMGFKTGLLLSDEDIKKYIVPEYKVIIQKIHNSQKPFLLHSCGKIFDIMPDMIEAGINAKHSNEDQIAPFTYWVERYGNQIGNFGGFDTDVICRYGEQELKEYITDVFLHCKDKKGIALGSGNSIPDYVPVENYLIEMETIRELRKQFG